MNNYKEKYDITMYYDHDNENIILIVIDDYCRVYSFDNIRDIPKVDLSYGGAFDQDKLDLYENSLKEGGLKRQWMITVPNLNYIYNIVKEWIRDGKFDIYDYYGNRPWYNGG